MEWKWKTGLNGPIKSPKFEKKFEREFFGGGIPSFLENSYLECEENVRTFPSSFRLVPHNVSGIPPTLWLTMWPEFEEFVSLNEDAYWGTRGLRKNELLKCMVIAYIECGAT